VNGADAGTNGGKKEAARRVARAGCGPRRQFPQFRRLFSFKRSKGNAIVG
jgi:hypothetical protein